MADSSPLFYVICKNIFVNYIILFQKFYTKVNFNVNNSIKLIKICFLFIAKNLSRMTIEINNKTTCTTKDYFALQLKVFASSTFKKSS